MERETGNMNKRSNEVTIVAICVTVAIVCLTIFGIFIINNQNEKDSTTKRFTTERSSRSYYNESLYTGDTTTAAANEVDVLYRPPSDKFCNPYNMYISGAHENQGYAKMRFGPSKSEYNVVGQINNGEVVQVQTTSVNGWTLIYYNGVEGWVRTDFLFNRYQDCFVVSTTSGLRVITPDFASSGCECPVDVYDEYDGEPLNMRSGPSRDYPLITKVPDESIVKLWGSSNSTSEWVYVEYNGYYGWVLSKYVIIDAIGDKPVLYLYPETTTDVYVKVNLNNSMFSCTYPEYNGGWYVTAQPDGTLINKADGLEYSYLYWELKGDADFDFSEGFVVKGSDTAEFLQQTLSEMGLTPREYNEFIVYWLPKMQENEYNLISFQTERYEDICSLEITPAPDSVLRVFMAYKPIDEYVDVPAQQFETFERNGFTVVEWGGAEVN